MAARPLLAAFRWRCTLLIRSRSATAALRVVSCQEANHQSGREMQTGALPVARTRTAGNGERRLAPHAARGPGRTLRPDRPQNHRPTQPGVPPAAGNGKQSTQPERRPNRSTGPPAATRLAKRQPPFVPCRGRARPAPWTPKARVHSPSSLPPEPPIPPEWRCRPSGGPRLKFGGKGGLRAPCGKDYPPNPPLRCGRTNWGVRSRCRALH